jgi:DNA polymerase-1
MLICSNQVRIVETESELPFLSGNVMFLDVETTSGSPDKMSINPWHNCKIAGICIAVDDSPVYYIPVGHHFGRNIDALGWLIETMQRIPTWANHNIKYDMHAIENQTGYQYRGKVICTLTQARILRSDRLHYSLDALSKDWLEEDINPYEDRLQPYLNGNKDYGAIPIDILGEYGGQDVISNRRLYRYIRDSMPAECQAVSDTEVGVTGVLYRMENLGMRVIPNHLKAMNVHYTMRMFELEHVILDETGYNIRPHVADDCYDLLCNGYNLPVLKWTNEDQDDEELMNPSFSKDALQQYLVLPGAPVKSVEAMIEYRRMNTFRSLFLETYVDLALDGILHPDYNQTVRSGRMSARKPNAQQLSKDAKKLILPREGCSFLSVDYSQIEFRLIVDYIRNRNAINSYRSNPDTDFHTWVANMCNIARKPAKNVNFCMGYGGGRKKLIAMLAKEPSLVLGIKAKVDAMIAEGKIDQSQAMQLFEQLATEMAAGVYDMYHDTLPELRTTSRAAEKRARSRGYVFNLFGRRRHLDSKRCHIAFNALNQSTAADLLKNRLVAIESLAHSLGLQIAAVVHDEVLFHGPTELIEPAIEPIIELMEAKDPRLQVPLRCSYGTSDKSWYHAGLPELKWPLDRSPWHATS